MQHKDILIFQPMRGACHALFDVRAKPFIQVSSTDPLLKRGVVKLVNGVKNRLVEVALAVAFIFGFFYSLISYPIRRDQARRIELAAVQFDLARFSKDELIKTEGIITSYFQKHAEVFNLLPPDKKNELLVKVVSQCARSQKIYGPIVRNWVETLLETANREGKKLVFMARDGIPFYKVAVELMKKKENQEKYPLLIGADKIVLGYFSRNLVANAKESTEGLELFKKYMIEELKVSSQDACIFVDIGFAGSMIEPIRKLLPENQIDFKFLVSTSDKAEGFLGNPNNPLPNLESAMCNLGVRWVEETHHGNLASAKKLVKRADGRVFPDNFYPKKILCEKKFSLPYLIRKFCLKGVVDYAIGLPKLSQEEAAKARLAFSETIGAIKEMKLPLFVGWDY